MQRDPTGYSDGMNVYAYVSNNPVNFVDPMGTTGGPGGTWSVGTPSGRNPSGDDDLAENEVGFEVTGYSCEMKDRKCKIKGEGEASASGGNLDPVQSTADKGGCKVWGVKINNKYEYFAFSWMELVGGTAAILSGGLGILSGNPFGVGFGWAAVGGGLKTVSENDPFNPNKVEKTWTLTVKCTYCCVCTEVPLPPLPDLPTTGGDEEDSEGGGGASCEIEVNCDEPTIEDNDDDDDRVVKVSDRSE